MIEFKTPRNRDAYAVIRGFVYQVDLTIERWIGLQAGEVLELERGEDIDVVLQSLTGSQEAQQQERLLEQVKHLQGPITLRTPATVSAIANFVEHLQANPQLNLRFRFSTTAQTGRERLARLPKNTTGIQAWEQVRASVADTAHNSSVAETLRKILQRTVQPPDLPISTWQGFQAFLAGSTTQNWLDFLKRFEWSTGQASDVEMGPRLQELLREQHFAGDEQEAADQYQRLFLHVFKVLSMPGVKRLTVVDRVSQLSLPTLNASDHSLLVSVVACVSSVEARISDLEDGVAEIRARVEEITIGQTTGPGGIGDSPPISLEIPPAVALLSERTDTVQRVLPDIFRCTWTALYGGAGEGKTHLAILVVRSHGNCLGWLRLRDLTSEQAIRQLNAACETLAGSRGSLRLSDWYSQMFAGAAGQSNLVLDDLPRLSAGDELVEAMVLLTKAAERLGMHIITTSGHRIPSTVGALLTNKQFQEIDCPGFTDDEAVDILRLHNAPPQALTPNYGRFVNNVAQHHPLLLNAAAKYLKQGGWQIDDAAFTGLVRGTYATEVSNETIHRLLEEIEDAQSRELLYRLNLFIGRFALNDVLAIAGIAPPVPSPRERLDSIIDLWVQSDNQQQLLVSPLVKSLGTEALGSETCRAGHLLIADRTAQKGRLNQFDASDLVMHLLSAEAYDRAAAALIHALIELAHTKPGIPDAGLLTFWYGAPLPAGISLGYRISLRGVQISARYHHGKPVEAILGDLESAISEATVDQAWAVTIAAVNACHVLVETNFRLANTLLLRALQLLPNGKTQDGKDLNLPHGAEIEPLVWDHVRGISTPDHLRNWIDTVARLTPEQRTSAMTNEFAMDGCLQVVNRLWLLEANKPQDEQQWSNVQNALGEFEDTARRLGLEVLWASAVRARVMILADYIHDLDGALALTRAALSQSSDDPRAQFLIRECMGRQYAYAKQYREALIWLDEALSYGTDAFPVVRLYTLLTAGIAAGELNPASSIAYDRQAVQLVENQASIPEAELVRALGELAVAEWLAGNLVAAFDAWDKAAEHLLDCRVDNEAWKDLFTLFGHVSGYLTLVASTGKGIERTRSGEEYRPPFRGIFVQTSRSSRAKLYDAARDSFIFAQLSHFAEAVGEDERSAVWARRGIDAARVAKRTLVVSDLGFSTLPALIIAGRYGEALEVGLEAGAIQMAIEHQRKRGVDVTDTETDADALLAELTTDEKMQGEYHAAIGALLPIVFQLHRHFIDNAAQAQSAAAEVVDNCYQIAETASDRALWSTAASGLEQTFLNETSGQELKELGNQPALEPYSVLRITCYLGTTVKRDLGVEDAASAQLAVMSTVQRLLSTSRAAYRGTVLPYLFEFWSARLRRARGLFGSPQLLEDDLSHAVEYPEEIRAQRILSSVLSSLRLRPTSEVQEWLAAGANSPTPSPL